MSQRIPQSATFRVALKAYLSSDHVSDATGKTIAVTISKNGAAFGNPSGGATNATEIANGWYYVDLSTTDTGTLGPLIVRGTVAAVDNVELLCQVVDANSMGAAYLDAAISTRTKPADTQARVTLVDTVTTYTGNTPQTGDNYARIGAAGAGLTALGDTRLANLDATVSSRTKPADTQAAVTTVGSVTGAVGSVTADVGITQAAADKVFGASGASMAELASVPGATPSPRNALMLIFMALRNKLTTTATTKSLYVDAGTALGTKALSDDGTTYTEAKLS